MECLANQPLYGFYNSSVVFHNEALLRTSNEMLQYPHEGLCVASHAGGIIPLQQMSVPFNVPDDCLKGGKLVDETCGKAKSFSNFTMNLIRVLKAFCYLILQK